MARYYVDEDGNITSDNKKKKKSKYSVDENGNITTFEEPEDELELPTPQLDDPMAQAGVLAGQGLLNMFKSGDWFQAGALDDDAPIAENVGKATVGTGTDFATDITAGILGIGEGIYDAFMGLSAHSLMANSNVGGYTDPKLYEKMEALQNQAIKEADEEIVKDLVDEQAIAKQIISGIGSGAYLGNQAQYGTVTQEDFQYAQQMQQGMLGYMDNEMEQDSVLGEKMDSLVQSAGQLAGQYGLSLVGVPWFVTSGLTSFGGEMENALKQGATHFEAMGSAFVTAGAEILSEKLFDGDIFTNGAVTDVATRYLATAISDKTMQKLAKAGLDVGGEAFEEVFSQFMSRLGSSLYKEEDLGEILFSEEAIEEYIDSAIGGAVLGGVMTGMNISKEGDSYATGLETNEQTVVQKVFEDEVAKKEENGKKLSYRERAKLWDKTVADMQKGRISAETIEETLGGDAYTAFKAEQDKFFGSEDYKAFKQAEQAEAKEIKKLEARLKQLDSAPNTVGNSRRYDAIQKRLDSLKTNSKASQLKAKLEVEASKVVGIRNQMRSQVMGQVQNSRLAESYRELARKSQKFETNINQYKDENARKTVQSILDSGLGDNTTQFHETVEFLAKLSADKGVVFDLTKTDRMDAKHKKEGYITNGYVSDDGKITLNMDSKRALNTTVGHEITHVMEKAGVYKELQGAVFEYAVSKEGMDKFNARLKAAQEAYKGKKNTSAEAEVTADLIGEYLFNDYSFVQSLSKQNRNVFQRIYDEIKYMVKIATAGSKEARELEKVKKLFDQAYRENVKGKKDTTTETSSTVTENTTATAEATVDPENDADLDYESPAKYSMTVTDPETIDFLENQEHITTYKAMLLIDGKLYPPMASKVKGEDGKYHMSNPRELGEWMQAEEDTTNIKFNDKGIGYYDLKKDDGGTVRAAYNPYEHSSNLVLNDQFEAAYKRENLVTVECVIPVSEMTSGYKADHAKDSVGMMDWHSGVVAGKLSDNKRSVYLSRYLKAVRVLSDAEVAQKYKEIVGDLPVPFNVVSPGLLTELENVGVNIDYDGSPQYQYLQRRAAEREAKKNASESVKTLDGGSVTKYSLSTWTPETQDSVRDNLLEAGFDSAQVDKWIKDTNSVASVIASDKARLDFEAADNQVMLKDNQEYIKTLDASTLCAKRLVYQGTFDAIQHRLPNTMLSSDDLIDLLNMMKAHGVQTPCGVCYVESRRRHLGKFAQQWLDSYEGEYKPRLDEVTTSDGLETLRKSHPQAYQDFVDAMNKKGSSNPKVVQLRTEYRNDIMSLTPAQIRKIEAIGGLRVQSFSDFETPHLLDMMQAVMDMSAKGLHSQAYTKVPNFAWVFGDTGIKINLSLIAEGNGFDSHGNLAFSSTEGMDIDEAMRLRDAYSKNVGTIIVGANDAHILACMADDRIDYIIPFHRSGWGMRELELMGMDAYTDYTYGQKEHDLNKPTKVVNGVQQYAGLENLYPPDYWDYTLSGKENAERYLSLCAKTGREPKFSQFLVNNGDGTYSLQPDGSTDGYWKTLIDFKMYDNEGNGAAQQKVVPNFNMEEAHRVLNEYEGGANKLPVANDVVEEFVAKYGGGEASVRYSMTKAEKAKMDEDYLAAVNSGDEEVMNHLVREYAKASMPDSKLVDENGNLRVVYHGTNTGDFTVFNPDYIGMSSGDDGFFGMGFYFAYSKGEASYYGAQRIIPAYLNLTNPFNFQRELHTYNGKRARYGHAPDAVALMNFADKFPDIAMHITMGAIKNGESSGKRISVFEFAKAFKDIIENKEFDYQEVKNEWGEIETLVTADPQVHEYEYNGETHSWRDFGFQKRFMYDHDILDVAYEYLSNAVYSYIDIPRFTSVILDNNREFTAELKARGYDGTIQSDHGDEAVAFYPNQIKSAAPITRDDDGNVIPLSKRFDSEQDDIRYSMTKVEEIENAYQYNLENEDMLGAEMAVEEMANLAMPDSKIRGKDGRLIPVYHGTNADFWEFDTSADGGKNGTAEGFGIYLSDDTEVTEIYGDRQIKMFANITKPATSFKKTITRGTLTKLIKDTCIKQAQRMVEEDGYDSLQDALRDTWISNYVMTYDMSMEQAYREVANSFLRENDNDKDLIHEVMFGMAIRSYDQAMDFYRNSLTPVTGIDGFITKWTNSSTGKSSNIYLAFDSSQLKSADAVTYDDGGNVIPLTERFNPEKKDIRFSLSPEDEAPGSGYVPSRDIGVHDPLDIAPVDISNMETTTETVVGDENAPTVSNEESVAPVGEEWREQFESLTDEDAPPVVDNSPPKPITTVQERVNQKIKNTYEELEKNRQYREEAYQYYAEQIAKAEAELAGKKNQHTATAESLRRRIEQLKRLQGNEDANYEKRISDLEKRVLKYSSEDYSRAEYRRDVQAKMTQFWADTIGDTSTWVDLPLGLAYKTKTLRRILRAVVRDANGKPDIELADTIYDELETKYDSHEAQLKVESGKLKQVFADLKLTEAEDTYAQMLGEFRHNPETTLTQELLDEYYQKHKKKIDTAKVDHAIEEARKLYDDLIVRVNKVLKAQGMREIPYRQGYFPHFTNPKQNWLMKALNWKPIDTEIPTSIAGLTQDFKPQRSWQTFAQKRRGDKTDYSLYKGLDTYVHGALDWIYHIEDLQSRRSLENYIRFIHSDEGIQQRIKNIQADDSLDADEVQDQINAVLDEAKNPLSGLVRELMNRTNTLAAKKSSMDREMEDMVNRKVYSTMTNLNNRVTANMVVGSFSSALTNFIPMVQSWHQVSPVYTVRGLGDMIRSTIHDDGTIAKSDFLTNRLIQEENLYKTGWDKVSDKAAFMMNVVDNITSQTVWRSKYLQNLKEGMSESMAIKDADQFAKNLIAGRSRGNAPSIFDAKNPLTKIFTAFQLEVANQYGYMFEDVPQDTPDKARLVKGYATAFLGAYLYNALYSSLVGRDAALDPIGILEDLLKGLFDDEEEPEEDLMNFGADLLEEVPFVGGLLGGGRIPIQSALPYGTDSTPFESMLNDVTNGDWKSMGKELLKPLYYLVMPVGGGQIKKTVEGLGMFSDDHPVAGSYTDSGKLRFPVEDNIPNRIQAALFGQYASKNARDYFDNNRSALGEKQIQEYMDVDLPVADYWNYRDGLKGLKTNAEKADFINSLDIETWQKNLLLNNILGREEDVDMESYGDFGSWDDFDYAQKNPDTYTSSKAVTSDFSEYRRYLDEMGDINSKDENGVSVNGLKKRRVADYISGLDIDYGAKLVLFKSQYKADDTYNEEIVNYIISRDDISFEEAVTILRTLGFTVTDEGMVTWD